MKNLFTDLEFVQFCLDITTILILVGMIYYTSLYRKRKRLSDTLFQCMLMLDLVIATHFISYILDDEPFPEANMVYFILVTLFYLSFVSLPFFLVLYSYTQVEKDEGIIKKRLPVIALPWVISVGLVAVNVFTRFLFFVDPVTYDFVGTPLFPILYIGVGLYFAGYLFLFFKINIALAAISVLFLVSWVWLDHVLRNFSSAALLYAVLFIYLHVQRMNDAFYEKKEEIV